MLVGTTACRAALGFTSMLLAFTFHGSDNRVGLAVSVAALAIAAWWAPLAVALVQRAVRARGIPVAATAMLVPLTLLPLGWVAGAAPAALFRLSLTGGVVGAGLTGSLGLAAALAARTLDLPRTP